jgi:DNA-binding MarR family transcriptional regulator
MKQFHDARDGAGLPPKDEAHDTARLAIETGARVMRLARRALRRRPSEMLSLSQLRALAYLRDSPGACLGEVADQLLVGAPTASKVVDELVERGLVRREVDPADRRRVLLGTTDAGRELLATVARPAQDELAALVAALPERERRRVREGLGVLRDLLARAM